MKHPYPLFLAKASKLHQLLRKNWILMNSWPFFFLGERKKEQNLWMCIKFSRHSLQSRCSWDLEASVKEPGVPTLNSTAANEIQWTLKLRNNFPLFLYTWHLLLRWQIRLRISFFYFATPTCFFPSVYYFICSSSSVSNFGVEKKKVRYYLREEEKKTYFRIHLLESISFFAMFFECILLLMVYYDEYLTADPFTEWGNDKKVSGYPFVLPYLPMGYSAW